MYLIILYFFSLSHEAFVDFATVYKSNALSYGTYFALADMYVSVCPAYGHCTVSFYNWLAKYFVDHILLFTNFQLYI